MIEEEIIEIIEELQCEYKEQENEQKYYDYIVSKAKRYSKGLQGLLDLYNKEKEKNKKLDKENQALFEAYNFNDTNLLAKILKEYKKELKNSISKDKIRERYEQLKHYDYIEIKELLKLLEE